MERGVNGAELVQLDCSNIELWGSMNLDLCWLIETKRGKGQIQCCLIIHKILVEIRKKILTILWIKFFFFLHNYSVSPSNNDQKKEEKKGVNQIERGKKNK
jgi:hypothetical protein